MGFTSGTDASENSRSLSNDSLNLGPYTYNLVNVHLTKLMTGIGLNKNGIILYYFITACHFMTLAEYSRFWLILTG